MLFFLTKRVPFIGAIVGAGFLIWGLTRHSVGLEALGGIMIVVSVVHTIATLRGRR